MKRERCCDRCGATPAPRLGPLCVACDNDLAAEAKAAVERIDADTRTDQQKLDDAVAFVLDTRLGGK